MTLAFEDLVGIASRLDQPWRDKYYSQICADDEQLAQSVRQVLKRLHKHLLCKTGKHFSKPIEKAIQRFANFEGVKSG